MIIEEYITDQWLHEAPISWWETHWRFWADEHSNQPALAFDEPFLDLDTDEQVLFCLFAKEMLR